MHGQCFVNGHRFAYSVARMSLIVEHIICISLCKHVSMIAGNVAVLDIDVASDTDIGTDMAMHTYTLTLTCTWMLYT